MFQHVFYYKRQSCWEADCRSEFLRWIHWALDHLFRLGNFWTDVGCETTRQTMLLCCFHVDCHNFKQSQGISPTTSSAVLSHAVNSTVPWGQLERFQHFSLQLSPSTWRRSCQGQTCNIGNCPTVRILLSVASHAQGCMTKTTCAHAIILQNAIWDDGCGVRFRLNLYIDTACSYSPATHPLQLFPAAVTDQICAQLPQLQNLMKTWLVDPRGVTSTLTILILALRKDALDSTFLFRAHVHGAFHTAQVSVRFLKFLCCQGRCTSVLMRKKISQFFSV